MKQPHAIDGNWPFIRAFDLNISTYYPIISLVLCICLIWLVRRARNRDFEIRWTIDLAILVMFSGFIGARIFHIFFEDFDYYKYNPIDSIKFWNGGFVFYGGALTAFSTGVIFLRVKKLPVGEWLNLVAPVAALGYALGRIACFLTGCCFGGACELIPSYAFRHPTQLYAVLIELLGLLILVKLESSPNILNQRLRQVSGYLFCIWIFLHSLGRIFMELLRVDPRGPMPFSLSISTWISLSLLIITSLYLKSQLNKSKRPHLTAPNSNFS